MAKKFYVPEALAPRLLKMLAWYENAGAHVEPGRYRRRDPGSPVPMHIGKVTETIAVGGKGQIQPWIKASTTGSTSAFTEGSTGLRVEAWDWIETGASSGEKVFYWRHQQSGRLVFWKPDRRFTGLLTASLAAASTSMTLDNVESIYGPSPTTSPSDTVSVANTHAWTGADNALVRAEYHNVKKRNEAYQITCSTS